MLLQPRANPNHPLQAYTCCEEPFANILIELELQRSTVDYICSVIAPLIIVTSVGFGCCSLTLSYLPSPFDVAALARPQSVLKGEA